MTDTTGRRAFLKIATGVAAAAALPTVLAGTAAADVRWDRWRFCTKCFGLFWDNIIAAKGVCPAGGGHTEAGYTFAIPFDVPENSNAQAHWTYCGKCQGMYFRGYPTDGVCPAGSGHDPSSAYSKNYVLTHDVPPSSTSQDAWRFCVKCYGLFFFGYSTNGRCPAGNEHKEAGYNFVLSHG